MLRLAMIPLAIFGTVALTLAALTVSSRVADSATHASEPTPPADCFVSDEPSAGGPAAPSDLTAEWSPYFQPGGFLLDAFDIVRWTDSSADESCFVVEMRPAGGSYEVVAILSANAEIHSPLSGTGIRTYRVYAAHAEGRSEYSNEDTVRANYTPPTPTPSPTLSPSPSAVAPSPTPAALPKTGGFPD